MTTQTAVSNQAGSRSILALMVVALVGCGVAEPGTGGGELLSSTTSALLTQDWNYHLDGNARDVAVDRCSNVYVTGSFGRTLEGITSLGGDDLFLAKYDATGAEQWVRRAGTVQNDRGMGVAVDSSGFVYVTGYTEAGRLDGGTGYGSADLFVLKYDPAGNLLWQSYWGTTNSDAAYDIAIKGTSVYVAGYRNNATALVLKLDALTGSIGWTQSLSFGISDVAYGVAIDANENVYIAGDSYGNIGGVTNTNVFLAKFSSTGTLAWTQVLGTSAYDHGVGVAVDSSGVYVTGYTAGSLNNQVNAGGSDVLVAKYSEAGALQWTRLLGTTGTDHGNVIRTYGGDLFVAGSLGSNAFLARYNTSGTLISNDQWSGTTSAGVTGLVFDSSGRPHVAGYDYGILTDSAFVRRYSRLASYANVLELRSRISNGDGTWCTADQQFPSDGSSVLAKPVLSGDVNADGRKDVVFAFGNTGGALEIRTKLANADGTWSSAVQTFPDGSGVLNGKMMTGDVNGDGRTDVILAFANTWSRGGALEIRTKLANGDGTWGSVSGAFSDSGSILNGNAVAMAADVNGDGKSDVIIAFANASGTLEVRTKLSNGDGSFSSVAQTFSDAAATLLGGKVMIGDVNADGRADIIFTFANGSGVIEIRTKLSNGDGTWTSAAQAFSDSSSVLSGYGKVVMVGDANNDGRSDVIIASAWDIWSALEIRTKLSNGNGTWTSATQVFEDGGGIFAGKVMAGDVNADGKSDVIIAVSNTWTGGGALEIRTKFSSGDGTWTAGGQWFNEYGESLNGTVLPADISGDGRVDVVSAFLSQG